MASSVIDQGKKLLKEITESDQQPTSRPVPVEQDGVSTLKHLVNYIRDHAFVKNLWRFAVNLNVRVPERETSEEDNNCS